MREKRYVLFPIHKDQFESAKLEFDPTLCGIFTTKEEAAKAQEILIKSKEYMSFILEYQVTTCEEWFSDIKEDLKSTIVKNIENNRVNKAINKLNDVKIEFKINRKRVEKKDLLEQEDDDEINSNLQEISNCSI